MESNLLYLATDLNVNLIKKILSENHVIQCLTKYLKAFLGEWVIEFL